MKLKISFLLFIFVADLEISQKNYVTRSEIIQEKYDSKWSETVVGKIKKDPRIYQIMLITNYENFEHCKIIKDLQKSLPTLYFNDFYSKQEIHRLEQWNSLINPRDTTLFFVLESPGKNNTQWTEDMMEFVKELSTVRIRPKCLILRFLNTNETSNYEELMAKLWRNLFLDVAILDVNNENLTIHQLNPFVPYKSKPFSKRTVLFPNKLRNLHGYPINIGYLNRAPYVHLQRNSTNYPINITGPDAEAGEIFAELLNFRQVTVSNPDEEFGHFGCNVSQLSGFLSAIQQNRIQYIGVTTVSMRRFCPRDMTEEAIFALDHIVAIVPTLKTKNLSIIVGNTFYYSIVLTVLITITGWIIMKLFKFDERIWNWTAVIQVLFSMSLENQPSELKERIIFLAFLVVNFYYSCNMMASLTDFNFRGEEEKEITTMRDLIESGLQLSSEINVLQRFPYMVYENGVPEWVKNSRETTLEECVEYLLDNKNVTCVMKLSLAEWFAGFYRQRNLVKFLPEYVVSVGSGFYLEAGCPYVEKFQEIYRKLTEYALLDRWQMQNLPNATRYHQLGIAPDDKEDDDEGEWKIQSLLIGLLIAGYLIAFLSFLGELVYGFWRKWQKRPIVV